ncbi:MAG TPA: dephospho-CoA kinase [Gemmatimonadales bacterium]|nr:dephospho-CoA kinase [Gemmatimonadales bacterium]
MLSIALTGNIASGKSTVARLFHSWGATVIDADQLVREMQVPGTPEFAAIVRRFGPGVVAGDGTLDRAALRRLVLADAARRRELEAIIHPAVATRRAALEAAARAAGVRIVVNDIPLLFESQDPARFDAVVLVDAPEPVRLARLMEARGLAESEARAMIATQMPASEKRRWRDPAGRGPLIIDNDADPATLEHRARAVWRALEALHPPT